MIIEAAKKAGIVIPTLCHHEAVKPYGSCRLCMVEIVQNKQRRLVTSCNSPVDTGGLEVFTDTIRIRQIRRTIIELLLARCPEVPVLQSMARQIGVESSCVSSVVSASVSARRWSASVPSAWPIAAPSARWQRLSIQGRMSASAAAPVLISVPPVVLKWCRISWIPGCAVSSWLRSPCLAAATTINVAPVPETRNLLQVLNRLLLNSATSRQVVLPRDYGVEQ